MNPEEVKKWYYQELEKMLGSDNPQDRRTALAELGKVFRLEEDEKEQTTTKLVDMVEELTKFVQNDATAYEIEKKIKIIEALDKNTSFPVTTFLLHELGLIENISIPNEYEKITAFLSQERWPHGSIKDINQGRAILQANGFVFMEPVVVLDKVAYASLCQPYELEPEKTYKDVIIENGLACAIIGAKESSIHKAFLTSMQYTYNYADIIEPLFCTVVIKNIET